ncbi:MAG: ribosome silencing factor [Chloroflexi bacterium]|jgi:ribosome-associated protein|nr:ribosome silencing factor [Chloroflexota bacterium]MBL17156.1 ribosome silencing factor [Chloroflexota bacterium]MDP6496834.1 ribosome silencing factor [Dehalococcoidia bacterium]MQG11031.1 ribosome silencing factor [SAR202 cluster bacterium]MQG55627.1 ribosome silencing factor [SAR202 cluster bacterium]|tara:strand:+ start:15972 stop:16373 length:402 start_codon:yes stop_codon:yes gene_type:complete
MKTTAKDQNTESTKLEAQQLEASEIAQLIVEVASEKLASDIVMLDLRGLASFTDYFVVMSADSSRLIQALEDDILSTLKESKLSMHRREGSAASGWVLMDCSDVIVHIFGPEERQFFGLERLWARAPQVVRIL